MNRDSHAGHPCDACARPDRRSFLLNATLAISGIALGLGAAPREAAAWPLSLIDGQRDPAGPDTITYPIPATDGAQIDKTNEVILVRYQGEVYSFNLACPHRHVALEWFADKNIFQCPKHHSKYTPDGTFISGRATRGMDRFAMTRHGANVVVNVEQMFMQDKDPAGWAAAKLAV
ncbi:MAG: ubiquinol-cytochrome c reductase iron-sulfur subunit [Gemmatimonadales bacterium]